MELVDSAPIPNFIYVYSPLKKPLFNAGISRKGDISVSYYITARIFSQDDNEDFSIRICEMLSDIKTFVDKRFKLLALYQFLFTHEQYKRAVRFAKHSIDEDAQKVFRHKCAQFARVMFLVGKACSVRRRLNVFNSSSLISSFA